MQFIFSMVASFIIVVVGIGFLSIFYIWVDANSDTLADIYDKIYKFFRRKKK